jgi:hypothetical protein
MSLITILLINVVHCLEKLDSHHSLMTMKD